MTDRDNAQICKNGHVTTIYAEMNPEERQKYCIECGEKNYLVCPNCETPIPGGEIEKKYIGMGEATRHEGTKIESYSVPKYCGNCGEPYPWTKEKLQAFKDFTELTEGLSEDEKEVLENNVDDILSQTPQTKNAVLQIKGILRDQSPEIAKTLKDLMMEFATEVAVKYLKKGF